MAEVFEFPASPTADADKKLRESIGKFHTVLIIGYDDENKLGFKTNEPTYSFMQYTLTKAAFELNLSERSKNATE
jgi:hypothetical protein